MSLSNEQCGQIINLINLMDPDNTSCGDLINSFIIKININELFHYACQNGHRNVAEWLYELSKTDGNTKIDIHSKNMHGDNDWLFTHACSNGHKNVAKWLYELSKTDGNTKIDIHVDNDFAFKRAWGSKEVAEWLYELSKIDGNTKIDIHVDNDHAFKLACKFGYNEVAEWLCTIENDYKIKYFRDEMIPIIKSKRSIIELINDNELDINSINLKQIEKQKDDICMICHSIDNRYWAKLECNHFICLDCITFISRCPMRCGETNMNNIELYDIIFV